MWKRYEAKSALSVVRCTLGPERPRETAEFRSPAPRVSWMARPAPAAPTSSSPAIPPPPEAPTPPGPTASPKPPSGGSPQRDTARIPAGDAPPPPPKAAEPAPATAQDIASLIESRALQRSSVSDAEGAWLEGTAQKLRTALLGYGLQAKIVGTRLTPNAALIRFMGSELAVILVIVVLYLRRPHASASPRATGRFLYSTEIVCLWNADRKSVLPLLPLPAHTPTKSDTFGLASLIGRRPAADLTKHKRQ
jgi:hypothetical protein